MVRDIITIDEDKCTGCGLCIPNCPEGALRIVDGKARLVSDQLCDGLGACLGECPEGAIHVEQREATGYDEETVMKHVMTQGQEVINAHLAHLEEHGETEYLQIAKKVIEEAEADTKTDEAAEPQPSSCASKAFTTPSPCSAMAANTDEKASNSERQPQWPLQLHLVMPTADVYRGKDVVIAADCTAFSSPDFHSRYLDNRPFAIACPKLDSNLDQYRDKIASMIDDAGVSSLTVILMQVPCCRGLLAIVMQAVEQANRSVPINAIVLDFKGDILTREQIA